MVILKSWGIMNKGTKLAENYPKSWEVRQTQEIGKIVTGTTPNTEDQENFGKKYPFITPTDLDENKYVEVVERYLSEKGYNNSKPIPKNSIVVICIASIGKNAITKQESCTNQQINSIICNEDINPEYLYYIMNYRNKHLKALAGSTTVPIVSKSEFSTFLLPIAPLPEQKKIADILSSVDKAIEKTDEIIEKTEKLKKGLMQELLIKGIGHRKYKEVRVGPREIQIPVAWEIKRIDEIAKVKGGKRVPKNMSLVEEETPYPYIRVADFKDQSVNTSDMKYATEAIYKEISKYTISKDDVYISIAGTIGLTGVVPDELDGQLLTENAAKIVINEKNRVSNIFLAYALSGFEPQSQINGFIGTTGVPKLALKRVKKIEFPLPPLKEQKKIASILLSVDNKIQKEKQYKEKLEKLKKGLMQKLLTGEVRVKTAN